MYVPSSPMNKDTHIGMGMIVEGFLSKFSTMLPSLVGT